MIETAVLLLGYKRTDNIKKRLDELSKNIDVPIIVSIDGGITLQEKQEILAAVNSFERKENKSNWKVTFRPSNLGLAKHLSQAVSEVLNEYKYCIVIEDDVTISENFVANLLECSVLFGRKDVLTVGGFSPGVPYFQVRLSRNFFRETHYFSAWGWMISKEKWAEFDLQLYEERIPLELCSSTTWKRLNTIQKKVWVRRFEKVSVASPSTWDYQMQYLAFKNDWLNILPTYKICDNLGFEDARSTHTNGRRPKWMATERNLPNDTFSLSELITIDSKRGKFLNYLDSIFIAGDSRIVRIRNILIDFIKLKKRRRK